MEVKEAASNAAETAQSQAEDLRGQARTKVRDQVDERSTQLGEQVGTTAGDLRSVAETLREQDKSGPAGYADQAADRVEQAGRWLTESDGERLLRDVEDFGRRNPWAVVAGAFAIGFAASRVMKASSSERHGASQSGGSSQLSGNGASAGSSSSGNGSAAQLPQAETVPVPHGGA